MKNETKVTNVNVKELEKILEAHKRAPWSIFHDIKTLSQMIDIVEKNGIDALNEELRRDDISAYHEEEASCGCL